MNDDNPTVGYDITFAVSCLGVWRVSALMIRYSLTLKKKEPWGFFGDCVGLTVSMASSLCRQQRPHDFIITSC